jgi:hypothetical protein
MMNQSIAFFDLGSIMSQLVTPKWSNTTFDYQLSHFGISEKKQL